MEINDLFQSMLDHLQLISMQKENQEIFHVKLLLDNQEQFDSNTLYVGRISSLSKGNRTQDACFLGINDLALTEQELSSHFANYALLKENDDLNQVFNEAVDMIGSNQKYMFSSSALLQILIQDRGLSYIIDMAYKLLNNPILLVDASYKLLASSKKDEYVDDLVWNELLTKGYCSYDMVSTFMKEGVVKKIAVSEKPLLTDSGFSEKVRRIHGKIIVNNQLVGYLGVLEYHQAFKEEDYGIIQLLCDVISAEMQKRNQAGLMYENILVDLLDNAIPNKEHLQERMKTAGLRLQSNLYVAVIHFHHEDIANYHFIYYLKEYIDQLLRDSRSVFYHNQIVTFLSLKEDQISNMLLKLQQCVEENRLKAGVSTKFSNILHLQKAYQRANKALELGNLLSDSKKIYQYEDYRLYHILSQAGQTSHLKDLCHPAPLLLQKYDVQMGTDYYQTLYTYLTTDKNSMKAAEQLYIHRNTMNHRLKKITEIASVDFGNYEECVQIYFTCKIMDLEQAKDGTETQFYNNLTL